MAQHASEAAESFGDLVAEARSAFIMIAAVAEPQPNKTRWGGRHISAVTVMIVE